MSEPVKLNAPHGDGLRCFGLLLPAENASYRDADRCRLTVRRDRGDRSSDRSTEAGGEADWSRCWLKIPGFGFFFFPPRFSLLGPLLEEMRNDRTFLKGKTSPVHPSFLHLTIYPSIHLSIYPFIHRSIDPSINWAFIVSFYFYSPYLLCMHDHSYLSFNTFLR